MVGEAVINSAEILDLVDDQDVVIGIARRSDCHGNPGLIHRAVHVLVFNKRGDLLLQLRAKSKDVQPGKWDTSVGGHLNPGEDYRPAAVREMAEELGISGHPLTQLYRSKIRNDIESENIMTFLCYYQGEIDFARDEIDEVRFWTAAEIDEALGSGCFTPNFEEEWSLFKQWIRRYQADDNECGLCAGDSFPDLLRQLPWTE